MSQWPQGGAKKTHKLTNTKANFQFWLQRKKKKSINRTNEQSHRIDFVFFFFGFVEKTQNKTKKKMPCLVKVGRGLWEGEGACSAHTLISKKKAQYWNTYNITKKKERKKSAAVCASTKTKQKTTK